VLRGIDAEISFGEMTLLVGPSGCGKTTLISVIAGLLDASGGELTVLGEDLRRLRGADAVRFRRANLGFAFQQYNLLPALTAAENAAVPLLAADTPHKRAIEKSSQLLWELGLGNRLHTLPSKLSGGQQQRVAIARALVHEPRLVICDEPTSALDHESGHAVMEQLRRIAVRPDRAVIVVTHDVRVYEFADRIVHMEDGRVTRVTAEAELATANAH
jgi:putative ABC transport system ATP-binding protein